MTTKCRVRHTAAVSLFVAASALLVTQVGGCCRACGQVASETSEGYQHDMDIARLQDLQTLGNHIEAYHARTGTYPLTPNDDVPTYVLIATEEQQPRGGGPPQPHRNGRVQDLEAELERVLAIDVQMPFDPQRVATSGRPNFYIYMVRRGAYHLAVHVHNPFSFARRIGDHHYKVEISNAPNPALNIMPLQQLLANPDFQAAITEPMHRPGYIEELRR